MMTKRAIQSLEANLSCAEFAGRGKFMWNNPDHNTQHCLTVEAARRLAETNRREHHQINTATQVRPSGRELSRFDRWKVDHQPEKRDL